MTFATEKAAALAALNAALSAVNAIQQDLLTPPPPGKTQVWLYNNGTLKVSALTAAGVPVQGWSDYAYPVSGGGSANYYVQGGAQAATSQGLRLILAVGALTAAQAVQIAESCINGGQPNALIRIMWEGNQHSWMPQWNQNVFTAAAFQTEFKLIVDSMMSVSGAAFQFIFNPNVDNNNGNCLPGRTDFDGYVAGNQANGRPYVDYIGIDGYDNEGAFSNDLAAWESFIAQAKALGKPWGACEWGLSQAQGGDDPAYINGMFALFGGEEEGDAASFQSYFSLNNGSINSDITTAPKSLAAFEAAAKGE